MSNFPIYLINQISSILSPNYVNTFNESILVGNKSRLYSESFEDFIAEVLGNILTNESDENDVRDAKNNTVRNSKKMKTAWIKAFNKELKDLESTPISSRTITKEMDAYKIMTPDELYRAFGVNEMEELKTLRINEVNKWKNSDNFNFINFRYFEYKRPYQKLAAFKNDLTLAILEIIDEQFNGCLDGVIVKRATDLIENPVFTANKVLMQMDRIIDKDSKSSFLFNDYEVSDGFILRTLVRESENVTMTSCYGLDERDSSIIDMIYSKITPNFFKDKTIEIDIGEVVRKIYENTNGYAYKDAEERILKISMYQIQGLIKEQENIKDTKFIINFFDNAFIRTNTITNKRVAKIVFGEILFNLYIQNKTVGVSSHQLKKIKQRLSKILIYPLQKSRLEKSVSGNEYNHSEEYNYQYFKNRVRFPTRKKADNMKIIESSLEEFKAAQFLIKDFIKTKQDSFIVEYVTLSQEEKEFFGILDNKIIEQTNFLTESLV